MKDMEFLEDIVSDIDSKMDDKDTVRELAIKSSRAIERLSRQMIQQIHNGEDPRETFNEALQEVSKVKSIIEDHPELFHSGFLRNGFQELAEAHIIWWISKEEEPMSPEELGITESSYLVGMGDVVGELRRMVLDSLSKGENEKAKNYLIKMERIKDMLMRFDYPKAIVPLKHKQDVARDLVEKTRRDLTLSIQNTELRGKINELLDKL
ncbi:MAG: translin family protein [Thermoplasmata archaeon]